MFVIRRRQAFTLIELLVVVAIIALLISILLPALQGAREQGKRGLCLANLKNIGTGMQSYSTEDRAEQLIPIQQMMVRTTGKYWLYRCANWLAWGGRDATTPFDGVMLNSDPTNGFKASGMDKPSYAAETRPLNRYLYAAAIQAGDRDKMPLYFCPSDSGYPNHALVDDGPPSAQGIPMYNTVGNSYRGSLACLISDGGAYAIGPWGHRASTLVNTSRLALAGEPTWFNMIGQDNGSTSPDPVLVTGWHKTILSPPAGGSGCAATCIPTACPPVAGLRRGLPSVARRTAGSLTTATLAWTPCLRPASP